MEDNPRPDPQNYTIECSAEPPLHRPDLWCKTGEDGSLKLMMLTGEEYIEIQTDPGLEAATSPTAGDKEKAKAVISRLYSQILYEAAENNYFDQTKKAQTVEGLERTICALQRVFGV